MSFAEKGKFQEVEGGIDNAASKDLVPALESMNAPVVDVAKVEVKTRAMDDFDTIFTTEIVKYEGVPRLLSTHGLELPKDEFFERPVVIYNFPWVAGTVEDGINPWALWANDPMVAQRLKGCGCWSGLLNLRFDVAASPYQYGMLRVHFKHFVICTSPLVNVTQDTGITRASQCYGVDIDAAVPGGKEMVIPYMYPYQEVISTTSTTEFTAIGKLWFTRIVPLQRCDSATPGTVGIVVRAWVTGMRRFQATRYNVAVQAQSGSFGRDAASEIGRGVVSRASGAVASVAAKLSSVPIISSYASGVAKVAGAVQAIADVFGFSRPRNGFTGTTHSKRYAAFALTDAPSSSEPASHTLAQARDLDFSDCGITSSDEMALARIFGHDSLLNDYAWTTTDTRGTVIATICVDPTVCETVDGANYFNPSSLAYGCLPFKYWRGSIIYTFRLVTSNFHVGKLRVCYEPQNGSGGVEDTTWPLASLENCTMDCVPGATMEVCVGWSTEDFWNPIGSVFAGIATGSTASNGTLKVYVENPLQTILASQQVVLLVNIRGGPDFQVFDVKDTLPRYATNGVFAPGFAEEEGEVDLPFIEAEAQSSLTANNSAYSRCTFGGPTLMPPSELDAKVFGERIVSLRALLKRFVAFGKVYATSDTGTGAIANRSIRATFPLYPPDLGNPTGTGNGCVYYDTNSLFRWFRIGYVGARGGMRYRFCDLFGGSYPGATTAPWTGSAKLTVMSTNSLVTNLAASTSGFLAGVGHYSGSGAVCAEYDLMQECDVEIPDFSPYRFNLMLSTLPTVTMNDMDQYVSVLYGKSSLSFTNNVLAISAATADDFSFFLWQGPCNVKKIA
jgi:hypothetical protein